MGKKYNLDFKNKAMDKYEQGATYEEIYNEFEISKSTLYDWFKKYRINYYMNNICQKTKINKKSEEIKVQTIIPDNIDNEFINKILIENLQLKNENMNLKNENINLYKKFKAIISIINGN